MLLCLVARANITPASPSSIHPYKLPPQGALTAAGAAAAAEAAAGAGTGEAGPAPRPRLGKAWYLDAPGNDASPALLAELGIADYAVNLVREGGSRGGDRIS